MRRWRWILLPVVVVPVTLVLIVPMMLAALVKLAFPFGRVRTACRRIVVWIAERWLDVLTGLFRRLLDTRFDVSGDVEFDRSRSYVLICNHQSWVDVPALLTAFHGRLPFWRFFLKRGLIWMPLLGLAFWALEYPFVRFPSRETLERFPERRGENLRTARKAIEHLHGRATTVVNFPEGAIFTRNKQQAQRSRYRHLLRPRAGGTALMLAALGERLDAMIDVTLEFPDGPPGLWDWVSNRVERVQVHVRRVDVPPELTQGDYENDAAFRRRFQDWLNGIWRDKDRRLGVMRDAPRTPPA
jgi:1-acyl-sn-glycerol-3-phosphate acyltransferase